MTSIKTKPPAAVEFIALMRVSHCSIGRAGALCAARGGDKLYHEHIYWDQASVLVQIGLLEPKGLPIAGIETAHKVADERLPSNTLMARWAESASD